MSDMPESAQTPLHAARPRKWVIEKYEWQGWSGPEWEWTVSDGIAETIARCDAEIDAQTIADLLNEKEQVEERRRLLEAAVNDRRPYEEVLADFHRHFSAP